MKLGRWVEVTAQGEVTVNTRGSPSFSGFQEIFAYLGAIVRAAGGRDGIWAGWGEACEGCVVQVRAALVNLPLATDTDEDELVRSLSSITTYDNLVLKALTKLATPAPLSGPCEMGGDHIVRAHSDTTPYCLHCERPMMLT